MKLIIMTLVLLSYISCFKDERPKITMAQCKKQTIVMTGILNKILNEPDIQKMHNLARSVEESRAVDCTPVLEECNEYYQLLNKITFVTKNKTLSSENKVLLFKMFNDFKVSLIKAEQKLASETVQNPPIKK